MALTVSWRATADGDIAQRKPDHARAHFARAHFARAWLGDPPSPRRIGEFTLRPAQEATARRIEHALHKHHGALLIDPPGTGKTVIALAVARAFQRVVVAAPAALRAQWQMAAERAGQSLEFVSHESLSRDGRCHDADLIVVDEAHHLRTPTTKRYARLSADAVGRHLLLLSATPTVNRRDDLDAQLGLIFGAGVVGLAASTRAEAIVRGEPETSLRPPILRLPALQVARDIPELQETLADLPPPLPAADGQAARALIQLSLAMAWGSSLAALDASLRRRLQWAAILRDALAAGRWPDRRTLRYWVVGDDATQLALPFALETSAARARDTWPSVLEHHVAAIERTRTLVRRELEADTRARADALRELLADHPRERIAVFFRHAESVRALRLALRAEQGVVAITGERVHAAAGRWSRAELLAALGPKAVAPSTDDARGIRLVLATDLLAEGVELQGAGIVVHGDAAWNPSRLAQRVGRAARAGRTAPVLVTRFAMPTGVLTMLRLADRLRYKRLASREGKRDASATGRLRSLLMRWAHGAGAGGQPLKAAIPAPSTTGARIGFAAVLRIGNERVLVAARRRGASWRISTSPKLALSVLSDLSCATSAATATETTQARRLLGRWWRRRQGRDSLGARSSPVWHHLRRRLSRLVAAAPMTARTALATRVEETQRRLQAWASAGLERQLETVLRHAKDDATLLQSIEALAESLRESPDGPDAARQRSPRPRLLALLIIPPTEPSAQRDRAPRAASPGSAAPR